MYMWYQNHGESLAQMLNEYLDGLVQDCSNSIANALELLQSCTKPSICSAALSYQTWMFL